MSRGKDIAEMYRKSFNELSEHDKNTILEIVALYIELKDTLYALKKIKEAHYITSYKAEKQKIKGQIELLDTILKELYISIGEEYDLS